MHSYNSGIGQTLVFYGHVRTILTPCK